MKSRYHDLGLFVLSGVLVAALTTLSPTDAGAQLVRPSADELAQLNAWIENYMLEKGVPGGLVAVASKGQVIHLRSYGMANVELSVPVTDSTVFEVGSISKQFIAAATMLLVQEERLDLDDPIHQFLPYLPGEWLGVTVRHLLSHTSGIPDYEEIGGYDLYGIRLTPEEVIRIAHSRPMDFRPGTGWYYSNTGYFLLSMILERIEGRPLGEVLHSRIFEPLGMLQTRLADPEDVIPHRAAGYWTNKTGELINRRPTETSSTLGAGGVLTSVYDLLKWDLALYGDELLSAESKATMWREVVLPSGKHTGYGFGWFVSPYHGLTTQGHGGQVAGFNADFARFPDLEAVFIVFLNRYRVSSGRVRFALLHAFVPSLGPLPQ